MIDPYGTTKICYTDQNLIMNNDEDKIEEVTKDDMIRRFKTFIKEYLFENRYIYRDQLLGNFSKENYSLDVNFEDINAFDETLSNRLMDVPNEIIPLFENAIKELFFDQSLNHKKIETVPDFQFLLNSSAIPRNLRELKSNDINKLISISGIIVSATKPNLKASRLGLQCKNCRHVKMIIVPSGANTAGLIPRICDNAIYQNSTNNQKEKCPIDCYIIIPELCTFVDQQMLKIQETPENIPTGEIPRSFQVLCDRVLVNRISPGTRLNIIGVLSVFNKKDRENVLNSFVRVLGFQVENQKSGKYMFNFSTEDEQRFIQYSKDPSSIHGQEDVKRAIACLLFGGCRKKISEGVNLRGDINILLLGDPSTAKSQLLKFAERVAPISVYTSGKGSSAAGLTASILKDYSTGEFQLEGGAMVLADGGVVCIDEFDKMRSQDRVAIHEAMEQQTISVAKAGITTTLNSRTSVLAAANPIYGRLDDLKSTQDQIDFQSTILSRFDCIFLIKDTRDVKADTNMAKHIIDLHIGGKLNEKQSQDEISLNELKKYIAYAKIKCMPRISQEAGQALQNFYVEDRKSVNENKIKKKSTIPVTVRQLEAIIRLSEAIAKMSLSTQVLEIHVNEAHRLFQISTLAAASSGFSNSSFDIPQELIQTVVKIEESIRRQLAIGSKVSYTKLTEELGIRYSSHKAIEYAILNMIKRDEIVFMESRKIIQRKK